jgi:pimeloyl-ACP methyl ester carboxylesterase
MKKLPPQIKHFMKANRVYSLARDLSFDAKNAWRWCLHNFNLKPSFQANFVKNSPHRPVILVQGFMGSSGVLQPLQEFLRKRKYNVILLDLGVFNVRDIRESADKLLFEVERIFEDFSQKKNFKEVDIVAHSMGGLIAFYYISQLGGHRLIKRLVTLGTPFRGTWSALFGIMAFGWFSRGIWQLHPQSEFIDEVSQITKSSLKTEIFSIAAKNDSLAPPESCFLHGAINRVLPLTHSGLIMDERLFECIDDYLRKGKNLPDALAFRHFQS